MAYEFRFQNNTSDKHLVYGILAAVACMALGIGIIDIFDMTENVGTIMVIAILLAVLFCVWGFWKHNKAAKSMDYISFHPDGFDSRYHGSIHYAEISSISGFGLFRAPPPSLRIHLKSGKKIVWYLSPTKTAFNSVEDANTFKAFTVELQVQLAKYEQRVEKQVHSVSIDHSNEPQITTDVTEPAERLSEQTGRVVKKHNRAVWAVPTGLAFAVLAFVRTCGNDYFDGKRDREMRQIFDNAAVSHTQLMDKAKNVLESYTPTLGPVYLYSNDSTVSIHLLPNMDGGHPVGIDLLDKVNTNDQLRRIAQHPDSVEFLLFLSYPDQHLASMRKSRINYNDSTDTWLYLRFYDPEQKVNPRPWQRDEVDSSSFEPFQLHTGIAIYPERSVRESLERSMINLPILLAQVRHRDTYKFYLTGATKDGITNELFDEVVHELDKMFKEVKVETKEFKKSTFNQSVQSAP